MSARAVVVAVLATAAFVVVPTQPAHAAFSAVGVGSALTASASIPAPAAPSAAVLGRDVTVSWPATTLSSGVPADGYTVRRFDTSNAAQTVLASCIAPASTSCVENNVPIGTWVYTVQARMGSWTGPESPSSGAVTVANSTFVLDSTAPITSLPAVVTGTISNFAVGESITYHLDSPTGPVLVGSPSIVTSSTSMPVSLTVPAGTSDAPHSVFVVGGSSASAAIDIVIPPMLQSMSMLDVDGNGKVDTVTVVFDDTLAPYTAGLAPWTLTNVPSGGTLSGVTASGNTATLSIAEGSGAADTAVGGFRVALASNSAGIRDIYAHTSSFAATAPTDRAAPAPGVLAMQDTNANGKVDRLTMTFSEALAPYSAPSTVWSLANVPSGGSRGAVTVTPPSVSIAVTEGAGAADTAVGSFTVTLAPSAVGVRDVAGNLSSFTKAPTDGARPIRQSQEMFDDNRNGRIDRVLVVFSEALAPFSAPTSFALSAAPSGATLGSVGVSGPQATLTLAEGAGAATTAVGSFRVALTSNPAGIRDASGNLASYAATAPTDRAAPALVTLSALDNNGNGKVDRVTALFSETLQAYTAGTAPWTLAGVPSGGTLVGVTGAAATLTLTLTEGPGAANTSVGSMTVAMASNAAGARDALANLGSFTASAPLDRAKPASVTITDTNGSTDGRVQPGDTVVITFSEPLAPASVPGSTTVILTDPTGTGNDTLTMLGVSNGARSLGSNNYITLDTGVASFAGSAVTLSNSNRTITVTVGPSCTGTGCGALGQQTTNASYSFVAAPTLTDTAGNTASTAARTQSIRMF